VADILIASDDDALIADLDAAVGGRETRIRSVRYGVDVLPAVVAQPPDLVILDLQIGNMGGMAVCMNLRLEEGAGRIDPITVLMLLDRRPDVFLARRSGADGWLVKPLDSIRIRRAVDALLADGTWEDPTGAPPPGPGATAVG
jgi:DNA-binding response OmpR family regulator